MDYQPWRFLEITPVISGLLINWLVCYFSRTLTWVPRPSRLDSNIFRQYATLFSNIGHYLTIFAIIRQYSTIFGNFRHYTTISDIIQHFSTFFENSTIFNIIWQYSTQILWKNVLVNNFYCRIMLRTSKRVAVHSGGGPNLGINWRIEIWL